MALQLVMAVLRSVIATMLLLVGATIRAAQANEAGGALEQGFLHPPDSAKPYTWWHWMNGAITREGITRDLEEMKRVGLGGAQMFNVSAGMPAGPVKFMSPEWRGLVKHAIGEAGRLGLDLSMHNCAGWSSTGGPWITPPYAMQMVVASAAQTSGPRSVSLLLLQPPTNLDYYRDIAVLAFPTPPAEQATMAGAAPRVTVSAVGQDGARLIDRNPKTQVTLPLPEPGKPQYVQFEFARPFAARSLRIAGGPKEGVSGALLVSQDGRQFTTARKFSVPAKSRGMTATFDAITAPVFRVEFTRSASTARQMTFSEIELGTAYRIDNWGAKAGYTRLAVAPAKPSDGPGADTAIPFKSIIDLTGRMDGSGRLAWDAPEGEWTIMRFGYTPIGTKNHPAPAEGLGLECDKLSREAVDVHFAAHVDKILADAADLLAKGLKGLLIDSYEVGTQNWTAHFAEEFRRRRGYDPIPYLPAMQGRLVESLAVSERFLWDLRRTIADLFADNYYGYFREMCAKRGLQLWSEAYGNGNFDNLASGGRADVVMAEFWVREKAEELRPKQAASVAHTYGVALVGAESFTESPGSAGWRDHPYSLKALGDAIYCFGVNRFVFHRYAHQPWLDRAPGMTMGQWGIHFERTETWWDEAPAWLAYLSRCQYLLQQGLFAADICYYAGEASPNGMPPRDRLDPAPPPGYDFDCCDAPVLLTRMAASDGRIVLPDGMSYRVLVLPPTRLMTPEVALKIRDLVRAGAWVVGPKPIASPSLSGYPACDGAVKAIGEEVWGECDGESVKENAFGKGKVFWGVALEDVFASLRLKPDFEPVAPQDAPLLMIHRAAGGADIYFVANQEANYLQAECAFRVEGKQPEIWRPDTGRIEPCAVFYTRDGQMRIPLQFDPCGSLFVVFRKSSQGAHFVSAWREDAGAATGAKKAVSDLAIIKATYGAPGRAAEKRMDLTKRLQGLVRNGAINVVVDNGMAGRDPAPLVVKNLEVEYVLNGERKSVTVGEKDTLRLSAAGAGAAEAPEFEIAVGGGGRPELLAFKAGDYCFTAPSSKTTSVHVEGVPEPAALDGPWEVRFQPEWGGPESVTFDRLISWTERPEPGVKYYSGTAAYRKTFAAPQGLTGKDRRLYLDLGGVRVIAVVTLNGQDLGILWKPPFRADVTGALKPGENALEIKVVNLWPNRLIGDEQLPDDCEWGANGGLKKWPAWLVENKPRPTQRLTFATWKHWREDSPLMESGLLGPVRIVAAAIKPL